MPVLLTVVGIPLLPFSFCSSSTRSTTSSAFPLSPLTLTWTVTDLPEILADTSFPLPRPPDFCFRFPRVLIEKGARTAAWNSPSTTSDKTSSWRCAAFPHSRDIIYISSSLLSTNWCRASIVSPFVLFCAFDTQSQQFYFIFIIACCSKNTTRCPRPCPTNQIARQRQPISPSNRRNAQHRATTYG